MLRLLFIACIILVVGLTCKADEEPQLVEVIQRVIRPHTWERNGGKGTIRHWRGNLIIRQTQDTHEEISDLLQQLRKNHF